jgi:hypothetical protein
LDFIVHVGDTFFELAEGINDAYGVRAPSDSGSFELEDGERLTAEDHITLGAEPLGFEVLVFVGNHQPCHYQPEPGDDGFSIEVIGRRALAKSRDGQGPTQVETLREAIAREKRWGGK